MFCQANREQQLAGTMPDTLLFGANRLKHPVTYVGWPKSFLARALAKFAFPLYGWALALRHRNADLFIVQDAFAHVGLLRKFWLVPPTIFLNIALYKMLERTGSVGTWLLHRAAEGFDVTLLLRERYPPFDGKLPTPTRFIPLGIDTDYFKPREHPAHGTFLLSSGRYMRDHQAAIELSRTTGMPVTVSVGAKDVIKDIPPTVRVLREIHIRELREEYQDCKAALLLFRFDPNSFEYSGQTAILELLALNKPVLTTPQNWHKDYGLNINPNLLPVSDISEVPAALARLKHHESRKLVVDKFSTATFAKELDALIHDVLDGKLAQETRTSPQ